MKQIIHAILSCDLPAGLRSMYLEAKVQELFTLQLNQFLSLKNTDLSTSKLKLSHSDHEKLYYVKDLLTSQLQQPSSLTELSALTGINVDKLKKGFKALFGTTVFGHLTDLRMEKARRLLLESNLSIGEIAVEVGYPNPQHFTTAFKRKFGLVPRQLRGY